MARRIPLGAWGHVGGWLDPRDWSRFARLSVTHRLASKQTHATPALLRLCGADDRTASDGGTAPDYATLFAFTRPRSIATGMFSDGRIGALIDALPALGGTLTSLAIERRHAGAAVSFEPLAQLVALRHLRLVIDAERYVTPVFPAALTSLDFQVVAARFVSHRTDRVRPTWHAASLPSAALVALELHVSNIVLVELGADTLYERLSSLTSLVTDARFEPVLRCDDGRAGFPKLARLAVGHALMSPLGTREFPALTALDLHDPNRRNYGTVTATLVLELIASLPALADLTLGSVTTHGFTGDSTAAVAAAAAAATVDAEHNLLSASDAVPVPGAVPRRQLRRLTCESTVVPAFCVCLAHRSALDMERLVVRAPAFFHRAFVAHSVATVEVRHIGIGAVLDAAVAKSVLSDYRTLPADQRSSDPADFCVARIGTIARLVVARSQELVDWACHQPPHVARPHTLEIRELPAAGADARVAAALSALAVLFPRVRVLRLPAYRLVGADNPVVAALGDLYARLPDLEAIDLSRFSVGDLEPPVSPREFVERHLRPEQRRLVARLPSIA